MFQSSKSTKPTQEYDTLKNLTQAFLIKLLKESADGHQSNLESILKWYTWRKVYILRKNLDPVQETLHSVPKLKLSHQNVVVYPDCLTSIG